MLEKKDTCFEEKYELHQFSRTIFKKLKLKIPQVEGFLVLQSVLIILNSFVYLSVSSNINKSY